MDKQIISIDFVRLPQCQLVTDGNGLQYYALPVSQFRLTEKGAYLTLIALPTPNDKFGKDFLLKPYARAEQYTSMSDAERQAVPIVGNIIISRPTPTAPDGQTINVYTSQATTAINAAQ